MRIKSFGNDVKINEFTCNNCKSVIEYTDNEVEDDGYWSRISTEESEWHECKHLNCPVCKRRHDIK